MVVEPRHRLSSGRRMEAADSRSNQDGARRPVYSWLPRWQLDTRMRPRGTRRDVVVCLAKSLAGRAISHRGEIVGFVILNRAPYTVGLDWEAFDLLRAAGPKRPAISLRSAQPRC